MSDVTVTGPGGAPITIPVTSTGNAQLAGAVLAALSADIASGAISLVAVPSPPAGGGPITISGGDSTGQVGVIITGTATGGGGLYELVLPANFGAGIISGDNVTVAAVGQNDPTIAAIGGADLIFYNNAFAKILIEGGSGYLAEGNATATGIFDIQGSDTFGSGGAVIDAHLGATTVNLYQNSSTNIEVGGQISVTAESGTELLALTGASTVPVTVSGAAGSNLWLINQANAFIEPGAGNILIIPGSTGSATLFGGTASFGGKTITAPDFTGSATVFGGIGYYQGGTAGDNLLLSSTLSGVTTLIGGGNNDTLGSFASDNTLIGGQGNEFLIGANTTGGGNDFISGNGPGNDTIWGSLTGNNTIGFGSDTTLAYGQHGLNTGGPYTGNVYYQAVAGGVDNIGDFLPGSDVFSLSLSSSAEGAAVSVTGLTYYASASGSPFGQTGTQAILSDGSTINFINANVTKSNFG